MPFGLYNAPNTFADQWSLCSWILINMPASVIPMIIINKIILIGVELPTSAIRDQSRKVNNKVCLSKNHVGPLGW